MSFAHYDIEAQKQPNPHTSSSKQQQSADSQQTVSDLSRSFTNFASGLSNLEKLNLQIGTKRDNVKLRAKIERSLERQSADLGSLKDVIFNLQLKSKSGGGSNDDAGAANDSNNNNGSSRGNGDSNKNDEQELIVVKLQKELAILSDNFNALKRRYNEKKNSITVNEFINHEASSNDVAIQEDQNAQQQQQQQQQYAADSGDAATETTGLLLQQQQQDTINRYDADFHALLLQQREANISEIHQGVQEINTIFKDLNSLVLEQGLQIDTVENNLTNLTNDTQNAAQELSKANNYQKKKRKCSCIILVVLVVVVLVILLAILS